MFLCSTLKLACQNHLQIFTISNLRRDAGNEYIGTCKLYKCVFFSSGSVSSELPECTQDLMLDFTVSYYQQFKPIGKGRK